MAEQVIWIVVAIGIALIAFFIAGGMLGTSKIKITDLLKWAGWQKEEIGEAKSIEAACEEWLDGADKYNAKAILDDYAIIGKSAPFTTLTCCSSDLKLMATDNRLACATDPASLECNGGNLPLAGIQSCWSACQAIMRMEQSCRTQCAGSSEAQVSNCVAVGVENSAEICSGLTIGVTCS